LLVNKSWSPGEKGLIVADYNFTFPILARRFNLRRIAERYRLYAEPSWTGVLCEEILCLAEFPGRVFCAAFEPRDFAALRDLRTNLVPVADIGAGAFIDDVFFSPNPAIENRYDIISVARWARYKRYGSLFKCLRTLSHEMGSLRVACVGYPGDLTLDHVREMARRHQVDDLIDFYEQIHPSEVRDLMCASTVNVLWSRREGTGRSSFEGFLVGLPLILRRGFNYGHTYDFVEDGIGHVADEDDFVHVAKRLLRTDVSIDPRTWMLERFSATVSTRKLQQVVRATAEAEGERWTCDLAVRLSELHGQRYQDESLRARFEPDHRYLRECLL
jgi:glycosyltransferase involved in cell wall biosynthesis